MSDNIFEKLYKINVKEHVEKKGNFSYLSWPYAVAELRKAAPDATWETVKFNGLPYCETKAGCFVEVAVTVNGITLSQIHPVLDMRNQTILAPNAFQINTSIQRCLVKAIALHGLGLYIYAGEDLPEEALGNTATPKTPLAGALDNFNPEEVEDLKEIAATIVDFATKEFWDDAFVTYDNIEDNDKRVGVWALLAPNSAIRAKIKEMGQKK